MPDPKAPTGREDTRLATPREELERQITSWTVPKNEREWWACREIERLRAEVERLTERATDAESDALRLHHEKMDWFEEHATATARIAELEAEVARLREEPKRLAAEDVEWVSNDNGELGVKIGAQFFFLYKGRSLVYSPAEHDDGAPMMWRHVWKREFGECCYAIDMDSVIRADRAGFPIMYQRTSLEDGGEWKPIDPALMIPPQPEHGKG